MANICIDRLAALKITDVRKIYRSVISVAERSSTFLTTILD